jgi:hypothetical protein
MYVAGMQIFIVKYLVFYARQKKDKLDKFLEDSKFAPLTPPVCIFVILLRIEY